MSARKSVIWVCSIFLGMAIATGCDDDDNPTSATRTEIAVLDLDLAEEFEDGFAGFEGPVLDSGVDYVYVVEGTYSIWGKSMWDNGTCKGTPMSAPEFPSPGGENDKTGVDAETWFAIPSGSALCSGSFSIPNHTGLIRVNLDGGTDFDHVEPTRGKSDVPSVDHVYEYRVTGQGHPFRVRREDGATSDDYGILRYTLYRLD